MRNRWTDRSRKEPTRSDHGWIAPSSLYGKALILRQADANLSVSVSGDRGFTQDSFIYSLVKWASRSCLQSHIPA